MKTRGCFCLFSSTTSQISWDSSSGLEFLENLANIVGLEFRDVETLPNIVGLEFRGIKNLSQTSWDSHSGASKASQISWDSNSGSKTWEISWDSNVNAMQRTGKKVISFWREGSQSCAQTRLSVGSDQRLLSDVTCLGDVPSGCHGARRRQ